MEKYIDKNIYEIGGTLLRESIEKLIIDERNECILNIKYKDDIRIKACANYLLSMDELEFKELYLGMPDEMDDYGDNMLEVIFPDADHLINDADISNYIRNNTDANYCYFDYAYAFLSDIKLIEKCLLISKTALNHSIDVLHNYEHKIYINITSESCKLLHKYDINMTNLLAIAYYLYDVDSISCIIELMSLTELYNISNVYSGLTQILILDRIHKEHDDYIINKYNNVLELRMYTTLLDISDVIVDCYNVIKYMSQKDGQKYMTKLNERYEYYKGNSYGHAYEKSNVLKIQSFHNELLLFHFKSRGGHTKGANNMI
jgi:hypothetical protein